MDTWVKNQKNLFEERPKPARKPDLGQNTPSQETEHEFLENHLLPEGTIITDNRGITYKVVRYLKSGKFANIYEIRTLDNKMLVLKEFYIKKGRRRRTLELDFSRAKEAEFYAGLEKFKKEAERVLSIFKEGDGNVFHADDNMSYVEALDAAKNEFGESRGVFEWKGNIFSTYTAEEKANLNIVIPESDCFECYGNYYFIMEYVPGMTLMEYIGQFKDGEKKNLDEILQIMEELAVAVENIHHIPCVHMDISPYNVKVYQDGTGRFRVKVLDFGLAANLDKARRDVVEKTGRMGSVMYGGTLGFSDADYNQDLYYSHPDEIKLIDIYSLGAILYFMTVFNTRNIQQDCLEVKLTNQIKLMHTPEIKDSLPYQISENHTPGEKLTNTLLNECYKLAQEATISSLTKGFDERIQSATEFKVRIQKMRYRIHWIDEKGAKVDASQKNTSLSFQSTGPWVAVLEGNPDWIFIDGSPKGNGGGKEIMHLNVEQNESVDSRKATVTITSGFMKISTDIIQEGRMVTKTRTKEEGSEKTPEDAEEKNIPPTEGDGRSSTEKQETQSKQDGKPDKKWKIILPVVIIIMAIVGAAWFGYNPPEPPAYSLQFPDGETISIPHEGVRDKAFPLQASHPWTVEIVGQQPEVWLTLDSASGDGTMKKFLYHAGENTGYKTRTATIKAVCGNVTKELNVIQGINRADSLLLQMINVARKKGRMGQLLSHFTVDYEIYEYDVLTGTSRKVDEGLDIILKGLMPDLVIGVTHDVISFKQDARGLIESITLKPKTFTYLHGKDN